jgi:NAD(P)-dependent dehydrogenase (short-subunit alcohol dehydrogenase family)
MKNFAFSTFGWRATLDTNLTTAFFCIQSVVPVMKSQGYGRIINL